MKIFTREPREVVLLEMEQVLVGLAVGLGQGLLLQRRLLKGLHQLLSQHQKDLLPNQLKKDQLPSQFL